MVVRERKPETKFEMNLVRLVELFHSEDACREYLEHIRWPSGLACLRCGSTSISRISTRNQLDCNDCRYRFSITTGTIFHDTHLPIWKWFLAAYTIIESKKGVSANQIKRKNGSLLQNCLVSLPSYPSRHAGRLPDAAQRYRGN